jgi:predicted Rossmann fold flavoprotein
VSGVILKDGKRLMADSVIVATGGVSYPSTGATGDGYRFAKDLNHKVVPVSPSLVPFETKEEWPKELQGLALKNVSLQVERNGKIIYDDFGEMLFTHFGVSGPMILSASAAIKPEYFKEQLPIYIDLKPALSMDELDKRILRDFEEVMNKQFKNSLGKLLPTKMIPIVIELSGIDPDKKVNEISKEERKSLVILLKHMPLTVTGLRGWNEAIITKGGVSVKDINPSTMESKVVNHLYFCGEVLDLDAMTGGYNLQIAWSTGYLAGSSC